MNEQDWWKLEAGKANGGGEGNEEGNVQIEDVLAWQGKTSRTISMEGKRRRRSRIFKLIMLLTCRPTYSKILRGLVPVARGKYS